MPIISPTTRMMPPTMSTDRRFKKSAFICVICVSPFKCFCSPQGCREIQTRRAVLCECSHLGDARIRERGLRCYDFEIVSDAGSETIARHLELALGQRHALVSGVNLHRSGSQSRQR